MADTIATLQAELSEYRSACEQKQEIIDADDGLTDDCLDLLIENETLQKRVAELESDKLELAKRYDAASGTDNDSSEWFALERWLDLMAAKVELPKSDDSVIVFGGDIEPEGSDS